MKLKKYKRRERIGWVLLAPFLLLSIKPFITGFIFAIISIMETGFGFVVGWTLIGLAVLGFYSLTTIYWREPTIEE